MESPRQILAFPLYNSLIHFQNKQVKPGTDFVHGHAATTVLYIHTISAIKTPSQAEAFKKKTQPNKKKKLGVKHGSIFAAACTIINQLGPVNEILSACLVVLQTLVLLSLLFHLTSSLSLNLLLLYLIPENK